MLVCFGCTNLHLTLVLQRPKWGRMLLFFAGLMAAKAICSTSLRFGGFSGARNWPIWAQVGGYFGTENTRTRSRLVMPVGIPDSHPKYEKNRVPKGVGGACENPPLAVDAAIPALCGKNGLPNRSS